MADNSDAEMIKRIRNGDITAFNTLFKSLYFQLYFYCRKFVANPEDAKDLIQNVFLRFWEKRKEIDIKISLKAYLFRCVQNEALNYLRSQPLNSEHHYPNEIKDISDSFNKPDVETELNEINRITLGVIKNLPKQCREIFTLSRIKGLKSQEIAEKLNISVRTVDTQIYRALKTLKLKLKDYMA